MGGTLRVGDFGDGDLTIEDGGSVANTDGLIGRSSGSFMPGFRTVKVSGAESH